MYQAVANVIQQYTSEMLTIQLPRLISCLEGIDTLDLEGKELIANIYISALRVCKRRAGREIFVDST